LHALFAGGDAAYNRILAFEGGEEFGGGVGVADGKGFGGRVGLELEGKREVEEERVRIVI